MLCGSVLIFLMNRNPLRPAILSYSRSLDAGAVQGEVRLTRRLSARLPPPNRTSRLSPDAIGRVEEII